MTQIDTSQFVIKWKALNINKGYGQHDATNALKQFLIDKFVKFFFLIGQPNASKHL